MTELHLHSGRVWVLVWAEIMSSAQIRESEIGPQNWGIKGSAEESICQCLLIGNHLGATSQTARRLATAFPQAAFPL